MNMILSKTILRNKNTLLTVLQSQNVQSSSLHVLRSLSRHGKCIVSNVKLTPATYRILSRFESSQTFPDKDKILHTTNEAPINTSDTVLVDVTPSPSIPDIPEVIKEAAISLNKLGEPTLQSLGMGSWYTPAGWVQRLLEYVHVTLELPWWASITICVIIARTLVFPLVIKNQRNAIHMHNVMPGMQELQTKMENARIFGNNVEVMQTGAQLAAYVKDNKISPAKTLLFPMIQAPIFISFFMGLRKMAQHPVESMKEGGIFWFVDLTVMDQFYLLPLITCTTLWITLEVGADFSKLPSSSILSRYSKYGVKLVPLIVFPFIMNFPNAILVYWASTNFVSLIQVSLLKIPAVRDYFKISVKVKHETAASSKKKKAFVKDVKSSFSNMKLAKEIAERERLDEMAFKRAGRAPPAKTYRYNPTVTDVVAHAKKM